MESHNLPDNCVEYNVFLLEKAGVVKRDFTEIRSQLEELCCDIYGLLAKNLVEYVWHKEPFRLAPFKRPFPHAGGRTVFGENIEDEWFIVALLMELSKHYTNTAISVYDNDGQFLLIEAAEHLPGWLGPDNSLNRVWIHRGHVHIIPEILSQKRRAQYDTEDISVEEALAWLAKDPGFTVASKQVEEVIQRRIADFPGKLVDHQHRMHCCIPAAVAAIIRSKPSLLSAAIEAFYLRDPIDLRACKAMKHFPPETRVLADVVTSKLQYAQLVQQKYHPDKRTGWDLPANEDPHFKTLDLGVKIASGFEILCAYGEPVKGTMQLVTYDLLESDKDWLRFLGRLEKAGHFHGMKPGSKEITIKLNRSKDFFIESRLVDEAGVPKERYGATVLHLLRTVDVDINAMKKESLHLPPADDDSWLNISPEQVDVLLNARMPNVEGPTSNGTNFDPSVITESIKRFMETVSGYEGAEFPDEKEDHSSMDTRTMDQAIGKILELNISESEEEARNSSAMTDYSDEEENIFEMPKAAKTDLVNIKAYLHQMDQELAKTAVGRSFVRTKDTGRPRNGSTGPKSSASRNRPPVPDRKNSAMTGDSNESIDEEDDEYHSVDVNVTFLKNMLESCNSEQGLPGPASNLLKRMGVNLPQNKD